MKQPAELPTPAKPSAPPGSSAPAEVAAPAKPSRAELGQPAPAFELPTVDGRTVKLADSKGKTVVLEWFNPACPYCVHAYSENGPLRKLPEELQEKGVVWLSIVSEKPENRGGKVETIQTFMQDNGMNVPMLLDPDGKVGRAYGAKTTPHVFVIDKEGVLVYRGALDNAPGGRPEGERVNYVEDALADLAAGKSVRAPDTKAYG